MSAWNRVGTGLFLASLLMLSFGGAPAPADTITWTGLGDGTSWSQAANWDLGRLPNGNDQVEIPTDPNNSTAIVVASGASCGNLTSGRGIQITGGIFYLFGTGTVNADVAFSTSGSYQGASTGTLTVNGHLTWTSGTLWQITVTANGTLEIEGTATKSISSATLENRGVASWNAGNISLGYSTLRNVAGAELTVYADGTQVQASGSSGSSSLFDNQGTFSLAAGVSGQVQSPFQNSGTVRVESGTLTLSRSLASSGTIDLGSGAVLTIPAYPGSLTLDGTASVTGTGTLRLATDCYLNGTHQIDAAVEVLAGTNFYVYDECAVNGPFTVQPGSGFGGDTAGVLTLNGSVALNGGNFGTITTIANADVSVGGDTSVWSGAVFESRGIFNWNAGDISLTYSGILRIAPSAELRARANGQSIYRSAGPPGELFDNQGAIVVAVDPNAPVSIAVAFQSSGTIDVQIGTLAITGAADGGISGDVHIETGAVLEISAFNVNVIAFGGSANVTGSGMLRVASGTARFNGTHVIHTPVEQTAGNISVYGTAEFNASYAHLNDGAWLTGGTEGVATLNGDVTWVGGHLGAGCDPNDGSCFKIVVNGDMTADFPPGPNLYCWLFGTLENHGVFTQTGWLRICGGATFINDVDGEHHLFGSQTVVSCCSYSCGGYTNAGSLFLEGGARIEFLAGKGGGDGGGGDKDAGAAYTQTSGSTALDGATLTAAGGVDLQGGIFYGNGLVEGNVVSAAGLAPGLSPGRIDVTGTYTQNPAGVLAIEIAGPEPGTGYDVLAMTDAVTLSGTLNVTLLDGYDPPVGAAFDILTADLVSGQFGPINLPALTGAKLWRLMYLAEAVRLEVASPGDLNCDGSVNFKDINPFVSYLSNFSTWQTTYSGCDPRNGDINGDGTYPSFKDINPFVALLSSGGD